MKKINYWIITLVLAGSFIAACKGPGPDPEPEVVPEPAVTDSLYLTSFEQVLTPTYIPDSSKFAGSFSYTFDVDVAGDVVTSGTGGAPTAHVGSRMMHMKTAIGDADYSGGFGWKPGTSNSLDTLDDNDMIQFWYNYNGNTTTELIFQIKYDVNLTPSTETDDLTFVYNIPATTVTTGWNKIRINLGALKWDQYNNPTASTKTIDFRQIIAVGLVYSGKVAGSTDPQEVYLDDWKIIKRLGGNKTHTYGSN